MNLWQGQIYLDDRLFILDLQKATKDGKSVWAITTRRNIKGFPPRRVDDFKNKEDAITYLKQVEPTTPRISLGGQSPSPNPSYEEYLTWCKEESIPDSMTIHRMNQKSRGDLIIEEVDSKEIEER